MKKIKAKVKLDCSDYVLCQNIKKNIAESFSRENPEEVTFSYNEKIFLEKFLTKIISSINRTFDSVEEMRNNIEIDNEVYKNLMD